MYYALLSEIPLVWNNDIFYILHGFYINLCINYHICRIFVIVMIITGATYISQLLNVTHTLQELSMSDNDISDDEMAVISEALQHNKSLTTLRVAVKGTEM